MTDGLLGGVGALVVATGLPSALRLLGFTIGLMSFALSVSVVPSALNLTMYIGDADEPVIEVIRAG